MEWIRDRNIIKCKVAREIHAITDTPSHRNMRHVNEYTRGSLTRWGGRRRRNTQCTYSVSIQCSRPITWSDTIFIINTVHSYKRTSSTGDFVRGYREYCASNAPSNFAAFQQQPWTTHMQRTRRHSRPRTPGLPTRTRCPGTRSRCIPRRTARLLLWFSSRRRQCLTLTSRRRSRWCTLEERHSTTSCARPLLVH